ncbi:MAG: hypothetical protein IPJ11_11030 [Gemmatimonadetes bacterium]|nr:hypothetical protein [Gemmatimonadota bacterium]
MGDPHREPKRRDATLLFGNRREATQRERCRRTPEHTGETGLGVAEQRSRRGVERADGEPAPQIPPCTVDPELVRREERPAEFDAEDARRSGQQG